MVYTFDTDVAKLVGADAAAIFQNVMFWCMRNAANGKNEHDGRFWTYNSARALAELFPWLSAKQVRNALSKLERAGLVVSGNYNKVGYDRTKWYAVGDEGLRFCEISPAKPQDADAQTGASIFPNGQIDFSTGENRSDREGKPIPDVKPVHKPVQNKDGGTRAIERTCISRRGYGEYRNVLLSDEELAKFKAERPDDWQERIESMSNWCAAKGKTYRNYLAALRNWARRDEGASKADMRGGVVDGLTFDAIGAAIGSQRP